MLRNKLGGALLLILTLGISLLTGVGTGGAAVSAPGTARDDRDRPVRTLLRVALTTPSGVPATVHLDGPTPRTVTTSGRKAALKRTVRVAEGDYRVEAPTLVVRGRQYVPRVTRKVVTTTSGRTTTVRITYQRGPAASDLEIVDLTTTSVAFDWSLKGHKEVALRRTEGRVPARSVDEGTPVATDGTTATDSGLTPGTEYSYALFTKVGQRWRGPVTRSLATMAEEGSGDATYILSEGTLLLGPGDVTSLTPTGAGALFVPADGVTPLVGGAVVLPPMASLPGGLVGEVTAVADDGTVTLVPAAIGFAFDYYAIDVDHFSFEDVALKPVSSNEPMRSLSTGRTARAAKATLPDCLDVIGGVGLSFDPSGDLQGALQATVLKRELPFLPDVPTGATMSASVSATVELALGISAKGGLRCGVHLEPFSRSFAAGPVPMYIQFAPVAELAVTGELEASNIGFTASAGAWFEGQLGLDIPDSFEGGTTADASALQPQFSANGTVEVLLGGELLMGPGAGDDGVAGALAGIQGELNIVDGRVTVQGVDDGNGETCVSAELGWSADLNVIARAWVPGWEREDVIDIPDLEVVGQPYGGPWYWPSDCATPGGNDVYLLVVQEEGASSANVGAVLTELGYSVTTGTTMPERPSAYGQIWVFGTYAALPADIRTGLADYVNIGGSLMVNSEHSCCSGLNGSVDQLLGEVLLHDVGVVTACTSPCARQSLPLASGALDGIASTPNAGSSVTTDALGYYTGVPTRNQLVTVNGYVGGTVWGPTDMRFERGRVVTLGDSNWSNTYLIGQNHAFVENVATFLAR